MEPTTGLIFLIALSMIAVLWRMAQEDRKEQQALLHKEQSIEGIIELEMQDLRKEGLLPPDEDAFLITLNNNMARVCRGDGVWQGTDLDMGFTIWGDRYYMLYYVYRMLGALAGEKMLNAHSFISNGEVTISVGRGGKRRHFTFRPR